MKIKINIKNKKRTHFEQPIISWCNLSTQTYIEIFKLLWLSYKSHFISLMYITILVICLHHMSVSQARLVHHYISRTWSGYFLLVVNHHSFTNTFPVQWRWHFAIYKNGQIALYSIDPSEDSSGSASMDEMTKSFFCFERSLTKQQNGFELPFPILQFLKQWKNGRMVWAGTIL